MLRRTPVTPLVCLFFLLSIFLINYAQAAGPDDSLEILLKPNQTGTSLAPVTQKTRSAQAYSARRSYGQVAALPYVYPPTGITKVRPAAVCAPDQYGMSCVLPKPLVGQWEIGVQAIFARTTGYIGWPRYSIYYGYAGWNTEADLTDDLQLPKYQTWVQLQASYRFRPNWGVRYTVLGSELNGGGWLQESFIFGSNWTTAGFYTYGQSIQSKWQHTYQRIGLVYDALRSCSSSVTVFADWLHTDDKIQVGCTYCGPNAISIFSNSINSAIAGLEFQKCLRTAANGGTLSCDLKAGGVFLDSVEGWDVQAAARYSIPLELRQVRVRQRRLPIGITQESSIRFHL